MLTYFAVEGPSWS